MLVIVKTISMLTVKDFDYKKTDSSNIFPKIYNKILQNLAAVQVLVMGTTEHILCSQCVAEVFNISWCCEAGIDYTSSTLLALKLLEWCFTFCRKI